MQKKLASVLWCDGVFWFRTQIRSTPRHTSQTPTINHGQMIRSPLCARVTIAWCLHNCAGKLNSLEKICTSTWYVTKLFFPSAGVTVIVFTILFFGENGPEVHLFFFIIIFSSVLTADRLPRFLSMWFVLFILATNCVLHGEQGAMFWA